MNGSLKAGVLKEFRTDDLLFEVAEFEVLVFEVLGRAVLVTLPALLSIAINEAMSSSSSATFLARGTCFFGATFLTGAFLTGALVVAVFFATVFFATTFFTAVFFAAVFLLVVAFLGVFRGSAMMIIVQPGADPSRWSSCVPLAMSQTR
jgi:hypothetical protein